MLLIKTQMIEVGLQSGTVEKVLLEISNGLDEENEELIKKIAAAMDPILILVVGAIVGGIVFAVYCPIFSIINSIN